MSELDDLRSIIDAAMSRVVSVDEAVATLRVTLGFTPPAPGQTRDDGRGVVVEFPNLSRIAAQVVRVDANGEVGRPSWRRDASGERFDVADVFELNGWLSRLAHLRDPLDPMFDRGDPSWISAASIDVVWSSVSRHTADFSFGRGSVAPDHTMALRVWFNELRLFTSRESEVELTLVAGEIRREQEWKRTVAGWSHGQHHEQGRTHL